MTVYVIHTNHFPIVFLTMQVSRWEGTYRAEDERQKVNLSCYL